MSDKIYLRPSTRLLTFVGVYESRHAFTEAFGLPYTTFTNWLDGRPGASLPGNMVAKLVYQTGIPYETLFTHSDKRPKPTKHQQPEATAQAT